MTRGGKTQGDILDRLGEYLEELTGYRPFLDHPARELVHDAIKAIAAERERYAKLEAENATTEAEICAMKMAVEACWYHQGMQPVPEPKGPGMKWREAAETIRAMLNRKLAR